MDDDPFVAELLEHLSKPLVVMADEDCACWCHRTDGCFFVVHVRDRCATPNAKLRAADLP